MNYKSPVEERMKFNLSETYAEKLFDKCNTDYFRSGLKYDDKTKSLFMKLPSIIRKIPDYIVGLKDNKSCIYVEVKTGSTEDFDHCKIKPNDLKGYGFWEKRLPVQILMCWNQLNKHKFISLSALNQLIEDNDYDIHWYDNDNEYNQSYYKIPLKDLL